MQQSTSELAPGEARSSSGTATFMIAQHLHNPQRIVRDLERPQVRPSGLVLLSPRTGSPKHVAYLPRVIPMRVDKDKSS